MNQDLRIGAKGEKWAEALERYKKALNLTEDPFMCYPVSTLDKISEVEKKQGFEYPESLKKFLTTINGGFDSPQDLTKIRGFHFDGEGTYDCFLEAVCDH